PSGVAYRDANPGYHHARPAEELYDLKQDPEEVHNLADDPACQSIKNDLHDKLFSYLTKSADPVLTGHVPEPDRKGPLLI
ncbi:MAG: DUF4976 domain-containing protein, partial [Candidatus Lokiarchaeota archaeon]|nr:DUF4976 domain-containing protein [Candidatus Lokiarchaeota archaeon]